MSLPNYLARIKSAGFYRFVWDKSVIQPQQAETLRLLVGYSEKGPFNTPVYIDNVSDFINIFGNISKRMEKRGVYFHRLAIQALASGPILVLNLKPFKEETTGTFTFDPAKLYDKTTLDNAIKQKQIKNIYDTNRFWHIDINQIPDKIESSNYINIVNSDVASNSCSIFMRQYEPAAYKGLTFRDWYASTNEEVPTYMDEMLDKQMSEYFVEMYMFRGQFTKELYTGALKDYFVDAKTLDVLSSADTSAAESESKTKQVKTTLAAQVSDEPIDYVINPNYTDAFNVKRDALEALANDPKSRFVAKVQGILIPYFKDANGSYISLDMNFNARSDEHKLIMKFREESLETSPNNVLNIAKENANKVRAYYIPGYDLSIKEKGNELVAKILGVLDTEKGIREALTNNVDVEYHYIVDTFNTYVNGADEKVRLASIAKEKDNAFALINMPPMNEFVKNPTYQTTFNEEAGAQFDITKLPGNFKLASDVRGGSWCAYFTQLVFADGSMKYYVPSAALVSNNFMAKYEGRQPYYIVAGPTYGVINYDNMIGPDYNYSRSDLDVLEPMGVNAIIYVPRKGTFINSNQTAKQAPLSALSKIHVRELVIYLQNEIEFMLQNYQWELNTQTLRDTIKSKADYILDNIKNNGGVYNFNTVCDETNNTPEIIDNEMIVLDIEIEPARGTGKMVQTLTIHKTGGISSI